MNDKKIEQAISYASSSNQIEDNKPTKEELEFVKKTLLEVNEENQLIHQFTKESKEKNGKLRRNN